MRTTFAVLAALIFGLLVAPAVQAASPRIVFERIIPPSQDLGNARDIAIVNATTDELLIEEFVDELIHHANRGGALFLRDARDTTGPAEAHLDIRMFRCESAVRESERAKQRVFQFDAVCSAKIDVLSRFLKPMGTFFAKGEGTSPRMEALTDQERDNALRNAARYAAIDAAERITPRRVRESIALDESAPAFAEAMAMIDAQRFAEARAIWQKAMQTSARSAALRFNLGALSEAMGDRRAAEVHYNAARQLAPGEPRYTSELKLFTRRGVVSVRPRPAPR